MRAKLSKYFQNYALLILAVLMTNGIVVFAQETYKPSIKNRTAGTYKIEGDNGKVDVNVENVDGAIILGGDIVLKPANVASAIGIRKFLRWDKGIIPYKIADDHPYRQTILRAIRTLNSNTVLWYKPADANYSGKFINITNGDGCHSGIGEPVFGDSHEVSIGRDCNNYGIVLHELLHTAGLFHEQQRSDRDKNVKILWDNILSDKKSNFEKAPWFSKDIGTYNKASIMHYDCKAFSKNGLLTIQSLNVAIGQRSGLSQDDITAINDIYYNVPANRRKPTFTPEPLPTLQYPEACKPPPTVPLPPVTCADMVIQLKDLDEDIRNETNPSEKQKLIRQRGELKREMTQKGCN